MTQALVQTDELAAILKAARGAKQSLIVEALAGTGKTTALLEIIKGLWESSALVLAFNRRIADEMQRRMPPIPRNRAVHVKTLHAAGLSITAHHFPRVTTSKDITEERIRTAAGKGTPLRVLGASTKLLRFVKDYQHARELDLDLAFKLGTEFGAFDKLSDIQESRRTVEIVGRAYTASLEVGDKIDFPDQGWLPLVLDLAPPSRYKVILLDEYQDVNPNQLEMVERLLAPNGRIIAAGDKNQAIYGWRGASTMATWDRLRDHYHAVSLPLTVTWRCDREIVDEAKKLVPGLKARPDAGPGGVHTIGEDEFLAGGITHFEGSAFVLSRTNAALFRVALELWRRQIPYNITQSTDILGPLKGVLQKLLRSSERVPQAMPKIPALTDDDVEGTLQRFHLRRQWGEQQAAKVTAAETAKANVVAAMTFKQALAAWYMTEMMKASAADSASWAERIEEQHLMLLFCLNFVGDPFGIEALLETIYAWDEMCWITLSTVHKVKGEEADNVFLLQETFARYRKSRDGKLPLTVPVEETNIEYVALTRAKRNLTWVTS